MVFLLEWAAGLPRRVHATDMRHFDYADKLDN
jgi:hypothetical protein